ncbi:unnamed protein product [Brachionus calyciflorus]|uniref:Uncharacterized protein n=1 Tax=Brachionus calyciflorus TaxID=104777 RepID=A0A814AKM6_9BILA|nr:unnamed protein product [Brachionus calyciflorus]
MASSRPSRSTSSGVRGNTRGRTNIRRASVNEQAINNSDEPTTSNSITNDAVFLNFQSCQCDDASIVKSIIDYPFRYVPLHEVINFSHERQFKQYKSTPTVKLIPTFNPVQQSSSTPPTNSSSSSSSSTQNTNSSPPSSSTQPTNLSSSSSSTQNNILSLPSSSTQPTNSSLSSSSTQSSLRTQPSNLSQSSNPVQSNILFQNANPPRSPIASEYLNPPRPFFHHNF